MVILVIIIVVLLFLLLRIWWINISKKQDTLDRFERGLHKEQEAKDLLEKWGYTITEEQSRYFHTFKYGGETISIPVVIDYMVTKDENKYLVEVKSGTAAIDIYNSNTRRQILEYVHAVDADGYYLLNMEKKEMKKIVFSS